MKINALKLRITTGEGDFGFCESFSDRLTIIKGNNSSGKSTLFLSLLYGLGMEELAGGRNEAALPYAVKDYFNYEGRKIPVISSEVYVEIKNRLGKVITLRRSIHDDSKSNKLIDVYLGKLITEKEAPSICTPTYIHDGGAALKAEGFHRYLEEFLGLTLPFVPTTSGGEAKLYLQSIFAAIAIEQKRGWTDYIANIPYHGIRDARTRVVEFLLNLDVFETNAARAKLNTDSLAIAASWEANYKEFTKILQEIGAISQGLPARPSTLFKREQVTFLKTVQDGMMQLSEYIGKLRSEHERIAVILKAPIEDSGKASQDTLTHFTFELNRLTSLFETKTGSLALQRASIQEYEELYKDALSDLARNKTALKLRDMGATTHDIELAKDKCPTCHQNIEDSLLMEVSPGPQMDLEANIDYLDKQVRMLNRQIAGTSKSAEETQASLNEISRRIGEYRGILSSARTDVASSANESRAVVRQQIQIEIEIAKLQIAEATVAEFLSKFEQISTALQNNQAARTRLPKFYYSEEDIRKIRIFEKLFRANAGTFQYESAEIQDIHINDEALVPYLANTELREITLTPTQVKEIKARTLKTDIKADSSASDFVRLILSYSLALYQASILPKGGGRHPGVLLLDEPGQHSMAQSSQRALLQQIVGSGELQGIVAASFDESPNVFKEVTEGIEFKLIELTEKSIRPLQ